MVHHNTASWVVIPTYNEAANIEAIIQHLFALPLANLTVLIVDDNSPDGTAHIIQNLQKTHAKLHLVVRPAKEGLGQAYITGFQYAIEQGATSIVQMDADFSHNPDDVPRLLAALSDHDAVIGSRYSHGISVINWPLRRLLISIIGNTYARLITGLPYKDVTGGFRAWRASTLQAIDFSSIRANGYGFQIILAYRVWRKHLTVIEVPIIFTERREGQSKMSSAIIREAIWLVWRLRLFGN